MDMTSTPNIHVHDHDWGQSFFQFVVKKIGLRPMMIGSDKRLMIREFGVDSQLLRDALRQVNSLHDWPHVWEEIGDSYAQSQNHETAFLCYYVGQRPLLADDDVKRDLYSKVVRSYSLIDHEYKLEKLTVDDEVHGRITGWLQLPNKKYDGCDGFPCFVFSPGITATKEELDLYCAPLLARGIAVARVDNPGGFGQTDGLVDETSISYISEVLIHLSKDQRLNRSQLHVGGLSMGGLMAMHGAIASNGLAASVITIGSPCSPHLLMPKFKNRYIAAISAVTGIDDTDDLTDLLARVDLHDLMKKNRDRLPEHLAIHGTRDRVIPLEQARMFTDFGSNVKEVNTTHACLEDHGTVMAEILEAIRNNVSCSASPSRLEDAAA